jgi:DNA repair exonuclease SbcCD ATPase subunit
VLQSFAARLAGSLFASAMTGIPMLMIMLDEIFAMLDSGNRQKLMALVLDKLLSEFGLQQIFVISHQEDVINAVDDLLMIKKERGSSIAVWL